MLNIDVELQRLDELHFDITTQCRILRDKQEHIGKTHREKDIQTVWMMESWSEAESVEHKKDNLLADVKSQYNLEISIVKLYLKVLLLQSNKIETVMKKLKVKKQESEIQECPIEYTVQSYQEWIRTNPNIHALQSEILDLLAKKNKCIQSRIGNKGFMEKSQKFQESIDKLRSKTYFFLERDPLVDTDFTLHISNIVNIESGSFESRKIIEFVKICWKYHNDKDFHFDYASHYQEFVSAITEHMVTKYGYMRRSGCSKIDMTCDQIFAIVEGYVIPNILYCIFKKNPIDEMINQQYNNLKSLSQYDMGIKHNFIDDSLYPYGEAINYLKLLAIVILPTQKLRQIILSAQSVMNIITKACSTNNGVAGADEFMDVWVYVVIQAGIKNLFSHITFIKDFCNPSYMLSETGYYLSSLELAAEFIRTIDKTKLSDRNKNKFLIASPERERMMKSDASYVRDVTIEDYEITTCINWIRDINCYLKYAFRAKKDSSCKCTISIFKITDTMKATLDTTFKFEKLKDFYIPISKHAHSQYITISSNNLFIQEHLVIQEFSNYLGLGIKSDLTLKSIINDVEIQEEITCMKKTVEKLFYKRSNLSGDHTTTNKLLEIITRQLITLEYYSILLPSSKSYTSYVTSCVKSFQERENETKKEKLRDDGICDYKTFERLLQIQ